MGETRHIHMLGICGAGMATLACLLKQKGFDVTGSDHAANPPMSTLLEREGIRLKIGYSPENLNPSPDLAIIGNVIRRDNREAEEVLKRKIPYTSMPKALYEFFLREREPIVVAGTHGKTTTTNLVAWVLKHANERPSFLAGGINLNTGGSYELGDGRFFVVEGDEYDSAFFDKSPKFLHYMPKYAIITSIEFDHADIYKDIDEIKAAFRKFVRLMPKDGILVINGDSATVKEVAEGANARVVTYGTASDVDYKITKITPSDGMMRFGITHNGKSIDIASWLSGRHNASNIASAVALLKELGIDKGLIVEGIRGFKGVKRRQEVVATINRITLVDDFAHHPTAITETIAAMRMRFPGRKIWGIFEPRSNTTRRKIFTRQLAAALKKADIAIIGDVFNAAYIKPEERLSPQDVADEINREGGEAHFIAPVQEIVRFVSEKAAPGDVILVMSNGTFDNLVERLVAALRTKWQ